MNAKKAKMLRQEVADYRDTVFVSERVINKRREEKFIYTLKPTCGRAKYKKLKKEAVWC